MLLRDPSVSTGWSGFPFRGLHNYKDNNSDHSFWQLDIDPISCHLPPEREGFRIWKKGNTLALELTSGLPANKMFFSYQNISILILGTKDNLT